MGRRLLLVAESRPSVAVGLAVSIALLVAVTALIYPLREVMPAVSAGVLYLLVVLVISIGWGLRLGLLTSLLGATAFNFFHIDPTARFMIAQAENWVALGAFFVTSVIASSVAEVARTRAADAELRRREAELATEMARLLLAGRRASHALSQTAIRLAEALELSFARITLDTSSPGSGETDISLQRGDQIIGTLIIPADTDARTLGRVRDRIVPSLETLLGAALERERLQAEAVEADALRRSDEIKTALLRAVSHDLRTPLTAIVASGDALASPNLPSRERTELADAVTSEASRLSRLVDQLLDQSRLEAGVAPPRSDWCSIEEIARAAVGQMEDPNRFKLSIDRDLPLVHADAAQLERTLVNVLDNAARHSHQGRVSVRARLVRHRIIIRVVDRGPGIPDDERERVFEPFFRGDGGQRRGQRGSGLGLAIAKGFVEANGGKIWAESLSGQGTVIVIELPAHAHAQTPEREGTTSAR
jgi:two-component system, OmpR family, sensor histidine kinase KdpD